MEPATMSVAQRYNNFSPTLLAHLKEWEARKGIKDDELLEFEAILVSEPQEVAYKSTFDADSMHDAQKGKPIGQIGMLNGETIVDPGTEDFINLTFFEGGYSPGKTKGRVWFTGKDKAVKLVRKKDNPALYRHLALSNYTEDNANPSSTMPAGGYLYRLVRPVEVVEQGWEQRMALNAVMQEIGVATRTTLLNLAPKLKGIAHPEGISDNQLRENFARFAEKGQNYAQVAALFNADETKFTLNVERAVERSVVAVDKGKAVLVFTDTQEVICPASPTDSTIKQLVNFLLVEDGQTTYKQILALTSKADAPRGPGRPKAS